MAAFQQPKKTLTVVEIRKQLLKAVMRENIRQLG